MQKPKKSAGLVVVVSSSSTPDASPAALTARPVVPNVRRASLTRALRAVVDALLRMPGTRVVSFQAQLEHLADHPELHDEVVGELFYLLTAPPAGPGACSRPIAARLRLVAARGTRERGAT